MARKRITIVLELDQTIDRPLGTAHLPDGTSRTFHGWLALAEAIDALAAGPAPEDDSPPGVGASSGRGQEPGNQ